MTQTEQTSQKNVNKNMKDKTVNEISILLCYAGRYTHLLFNQIFYLK